MTKPHAFMLFIVFLLAGFPSLLFCESTTPAIEEAPPWKSGGLTGEYRPLTTEDLIPETGFKATVSERSRVRSNPSLSAPILDQINPKETIRVVGMEKNWFEILLSDGLTGWVHKKLFPDQAVLEKQLTGNGSPLNKETLDRDSLQKGILNQNQISLSFRDMDIRDAFSSLAMEFKTNIVLSGDVRGKVTLHIFKSTLEEAIETIAMAGGYAVRQEGNTYHVIKSEKSAADGQSGEPFVTKTFRLNFVEMENIKEVLNALPGFRPIEVHEATKTIFVEDTQANIQKIERIIKFLDSVPRQVMIEVKIMEVTLTDDMAYGVDWKGIYKNLNVATSGFANAILPEELGISPVPVTGKGVFSNYFATTGSEWAFSMAIDALKQKTNVNTVSTPKILAIHGKLSRVQVGGKQGYKVTTSNLGIMTETIQFIDTGVILEITPYIDQDDNILLDVQPTINTAKIEAGIPVVNSTSVSTHLVTRSGNTVFIGGLIEDINTQTREHVPVLGNIPILGYLFGRNITRKVKTETVVLITPRIIDIHEAYNRHIETKEPEAIE